MKTKPRTDEEKNEKRSKKRKQKIHEYNTIPL